ncbi:hypothetical protein PIB30_083007 [Stylosanthes scabra]|uniref:Uncharacterized protein n=1 Tax=Stylosanthes scabra TaxID=79078 RepID=A0ABU6SSN5_9FABA|nr:hypothetical protein [Stylosanthes scabra]
MTESSKGHSRENKPHGRRSVTPYNLNLNLGTPQGEDEYHEEEEHMEQQNLGARGGGTPTQEKLFTPHVGSTAESYDITEAISTPSLEAFATDHRSMRCSNSRGSNRKSFISVIPLRQSVLLMAGERGVPVPGVPISRVPTEIVDEVEGMITMEEPPCLRAS